MTSVTAELDSKIRLFVYHHFVDTGRAPARAEVAAGLDLPLERVAAAFERLAEAKALVLQKGSGEVLMAEPFSAVPTPFEAEVEGRTWWGNCIWDALGILALLGRDGRIRTSCGDCGEAMELEVRGRELQPAAGVVHYLVPLRRWWEDVVFA